MKLLNILSRITHVRVYFNTFLINETNKVIALERLPGMLSSATLKLSFKVAVMYF